PTAQWPAHTQDIGTVFNTVGGRQFQCLACEPATEPLVVVDRPHPFNLFKAAQRKNVIVILQLTAEDNSRMGIIFEPQICLWGLRPDPSGTAQQEEKQERRALAKGA